MFKIMFLLVHASDSGEAVFFEWIISFVLAVYRAALSPDHMSCEKGGAESVMLEKQKASY